MSSARSFSPDRRADEEVAALGRTDAGSSWATAATGRRPSKRPAPRPLTSDAPAIVGVVELRLSSRRVSAWDGPGLWQARGQSKEISTFHLVLWSSGYLDNFATLNRPVIGLLSWTGPIRPRSSEQLGRTIDRTLLNHGAQPIGARNQAAQSQTVPNQTCSMRQSMPKSSPSPKSQNQYQVTR